MPTITLLTCDKRPALADSDALLAEALSQRGVTVRACPWTKLEPAAAGDLVVVRSTWDYYERAAEFSAWLDRMAVLQVPLLNPVSMLRWNLDKLYLRELERAGAPLPRTHWLAAPDPASVAAILTAEQWSAAVVKPRISATAYGTVRVTQGTPPSAEALAVAREVGALVQEFVPEVASAGEISFLFFDGDFSHAVRKSPGVGDFRVQTEFGGSIVPFEADAALRDAAAGVLAACPGAPLYARVDLIPTAAGPRLMEVELIEPDLFLDYVEGAADRLAECLLRRLAA